MNAKTKNKENPMQRIRIKKLTLNIGAGKDQNKLEKGIKLLKLITDMEPKKSTTNKRIPGWGLRPGLAIGCNVTIRDKKKILDLMKRFVEAKENMFSESMFDNNGNLSFGFAEYIDIEGVKYDPDIGVIGFNIAITFEKPGYRVKQRLYKRSKIGKSHLITKEETIDFMKKNFDIKLEEEEEE